MKKSALLGILLFLFSGCSNTKNEIEHSQQEKEAVVLAFQNMNLVVKNKTKNILVILDSEMAFSIRKNDKWVLIDESKVSSMITSSIEGDGELKFDLKNDLSMITSEEIQVTVHYYFANNIDEKKTKKIIYKR